MSSEPGPASSGNAPEDQSKAENEDAGNNPYWGRPGLLDWYGSLGFRGKLRWVAGIFITANGVAWLFGFFWPRMLMTAAALLIVSFLLPSSIDD